MTIYRTLTAVAAIAMIAATGCRPEPASEAESAPEPKYAVDHHSFGNPNEIAVTHLDLVLNVDFDKRMLMGTATFKLERNSGNTLVLDARDLDIRSVKHGKPLEGGEHAVAEFKIKEGNEHGDILEIQLNDSAELVTIDYSTSPDAAALLWHSPSQTHDKNSPFLFTQGQAILTRSWIPIQDSPALRITYNAKIRTPEGMLAVMSAENPTEKNEDGVFEFRMEQPIPPYLMALAVGDLEFAPLGDRTGVYAEPGLLEAAAREFEDTEKMLETAENLYGPYVWDRFDILVLPPSFPFGGMENPRLTFATPTIIAGDKSLTGLIAHELAHSWSGNLVTNGSWNDFWLNEGFTVYFEKRIMEALYGPEYAEMLNVLGYQDLLATIERLGPESEDTELKLDLEGRNPDDGMNDIAYEKGYLMLRSLEEWAGREAFDAFLMEYFRVHAFETMTTARFIDYLDATLFADAKERPDVEAWIYKPGLPEGHPVPVSDVFDRVDSVRNMWLEDQTAAAVLPVEKWSTHEWLHFLRGIPEGIPAEQLAELDAAFDLTKSGNSEIAFAWFLQSIHSDYRPAFDAMEAFLIEVGRRKFLEPLYAALAEDEAHLKWAKRVYKEARPNYHSVTAVTIDEVLDAGE
ncbi:MAG: M1 family metallopeptidase [Flavobacteriales bacterium]|nr:M1 family metallopeptidase [Flavobacteriales bacterium]